MSSVGLYSATSSYLNVGPVDISTDVQEVFMATAENNIRTDRSANGGSKIGAPAGPFHACIADVTAGGQCEGTRIFKTSEYKFSVFGYASGEAYDMVVKAGQNGLPAGMDHVAVRMKFEAVGFTNIMVNSREFDPAKTNEDIQRIEFLRDEGESMRIEFPKNYNVGTKHDKTDGTTMPLDATKQVKIKVSSAAENSLYIDYLFETASIARGKYFMYDPTVSPGAFPNPQPTKPLGSRGVRTGAAVAALCFSALAAVAAAFA